VATRSKEVRLVRTITTTNRPDEKIEVTEAEFTDLNRQGLVKTDHTKKADRPEGNSN
jgi:hypothetical protein